MEKTREFHAEWLSIIFKSVSHYFQSEKTSNRNLEVFTMQKGNGWGSLCLKVYKYVQDSLLFFDGIIFQIM